MVDQDSGMEERHCHHAWAQGQWVDGCNADYGGVGMAGLGGDVIRRYRRDNARAREAGLNEYLRIQSTNESRCMRMFICVCLCTCS